MAVSVLALLDSVDTAGAGDASTLTDVATACTAQLVVESGELLSIGVAIEASLDGDNWEAFGLISQPISGKCVSWHGRPFAFLRANLLALTGTTPVVSINAVTA